MKKIKFNVSLFTAMIACMMLLSGGFCSHDDPVTLSVSPTSLTFSAVSPPEQSVTITTDADSWMPQVSASWVIVAQDPVGKVLKVSAQDNTSTTNARDANITITAGNAPAVTISVTQSPRDGLSISPTSLTFEANETGTQTVVVTTNASSCEATSSDSWATVSTSGKNVNVKVSNNTSTSADRTATVTVKAGNANPATFTVTQKHMNTLSVSPSSLSFTYNATTGQDLTVSTNATSWSVSKPSADTWYSYSFNNNVLKVIPTANTGSQRTSTLTFEAGSATPFKVTITQPGPNTTKAQVRFRKVISTPYITALGLFTSNGIFLVSSNFGSSSGTSAYYSITAGNYQRMYYEVDTWRSHGVLFNFQENHKYTFELSSEDADYWYFSTYDDGLASVQQGNIISNNPPEVIAVPKKR